MTPDASRARICGRKVIMLTLEQAEAQAKVMHKLYKARYAAYQCRYCGGFHVGRVRSRQAALRREERRGTD